MGSATTPKTSEIYEPVANQFIVKGVAVSVQSLHGIQFPCPGNGSATEDHQAGRARESLISRSALRQCAFSRLRNFLFFLAWNSCAFLARFRQADSDRLLAALYCASLAAFAGFQCAPLLAPHRPGDCFRCTLTVATAGRLLLGWHEIPPSTLERQQSRNGCVSCVPPNNLKPPSRPTSLSAVRSFRRTGSHDSGPPDRSGCSRCWLRFETDP